MPSNRFDDDMPKITLDKEDREAFRQSRSKGNYSASVSATSSETSIPPVPQSAPTSSGGSSPVLITILVLLIFAGFGGSYWLYQQQVVLKQTLANSQERIVELEKQLSATGEEMGESAVAIQTKVNQLNAKTKELWDQMDKLWASAWRRNQSEIKEMGGKIDTLVANDGDIEKQIKSLESEIGTSMTNLDLVQEQINRQSKDISQFSTEVSTNKQQVTSQGKTISALNQKLATMDKVNNALLKRINDLEKWQKTQSALESKNIKTEPPKKALPPPITVGE
ncbi:hypothetical protein [Alteromonas sp. a30]|uniref:hypothetical protein n=1 Tax=Alteromonas sp. a30 TaxID=2730917 RepID=UPI00227E4FF1|nr:hypothetical protein [Alteromonas sp. a30]MCY7295362.1 hypothetical protein [Alteromonas sp. a30]